MLLDDDDDESLEHDVFGGVPTPVGNPGRPRSRPRSRGNASSKATSLTPSQPTRVQRRSFAASIETRERRRGDADSKALGSASGSDAWEDTSDGEVYASDRFGGKPRTPDSRVLRETENVPTGSTSRISQNAHADPTTMPTPTWSTNSSPGSPSSAVYVSDRRQKHSPPVGLHSMS